MRATLKILIAVGFILLAAGRTQAQATYESGPGQYIGVSQARLMLDPAVQKELQLSDDQIKKATDLDKELREKSDAARLKIRGLPGDQAQARMQELMLPIMDETQKTAKAFLKPEQLKRLLQLDVQRSGFIALTYPPVAKKIGLTEEQLTKLKAIFVEYQSEVRKEIPNPKDRQAGVAKMLELRDKAETKVVALMTEDQKKAWKELNGEPYKVIDLLRPTR